MTGLIREFLHNCPHVDLVVLGEVMFFGLFVAALFWVFRPASKGFYEKLSQLPLDNGAAHERK